MKITTLLLALGLGSLGAYAQSSTNTVEGEITTTASAVEENPIVLTNNLSFQTNIDEIQDGATNSINQDKFYNTLGASKAINLSDVGVFKTTYTPSISATFTNADTDLGKDSDTLKSADIQNAISMKAQSGNIEYGADFGANYHYGYLYRMRTASTAAGTPFTAYRRNDSASNFSAATNAAIAISKEYKLGVNVGVAYQDAMGERIPYAADYATKFSNPAYNGHVGDSYDMTTYSAGLSNDVIINENFTVSMPITFSTRDYHNFNAFDNASDWAAASDKRLLNTELIGLTLGAKFETIEFSTGVQAGIIDDKSIGQVEDADLMMISSSAKVNVTETVSISASHHFETWKYDTLPEGNNEKYNNYSLGLAVSNVADLGVDAEVSHRQINGQCNFGSGKYTNEATALNLSIKL